MDGPRRQGRTWWAHVAALETEGLQRRGLGVQPGEESRPALPRAEDTLHPTPWKPPEVQVPRPGRWGVFLNTPWCPSSTSSHRPAQGGPGGLRLNPGPALPGVPPSPDRLVSPRGRERHPAQLPCGSPRLPPDLPQRAARPRDAGQGRPAEPRLGTALNRSSWQRLHPSLLLRTRHWDIPGPHAQEFDAGTPFPRISMLVPVQYSGPVSRKEPVPAATPPPGQLLVTGHGARGVDVGAADMLSCPCVAHTC